MFKEYFGKEPKIGDTVKSDKFVFTYKIMNITQDAVIAKMVLKEGEKYVLPNTEWNSTVFDDAENDAIFYQTPAENQYATRL